VEAMWMPSSLDGVKCQAIRLIDIVNSDHQGSWSWRDRLRVRHTNCCPVFLPRNRWLDVSPACFWAGDEVFSQSPCGNSAKFVAESSVLRNPLIGRNQSEAEWSDLKGLQYYIWGFQFTINALHRLQVVEN